jgi:hypothetical protein
MKITVDAEKLDAVLEAVSCCDDCPLYDQCALDNCGGYDCYDKLKAWIIK